MIETVQIAEAWLYATLSGDATLAGLVDEQGKLLQSTVRGIVLSQKAT